MQAILRVADFIAFRVRRERRKALQCIADPSGSLDGVSAPASASGTGTKGAVAVMKDPKRGFLTRDVDWNSF